MNALARRIARMIEVDGPISVGAFMTLALHDPQMGFYATRESIGAAGSFVTAPEISQVFGELIGAWCAACWRDQGCAPEPLLIDLGPGRGTLVADVIRALRGAPDFLNAIAVVLVEVSARLQSVQRDHLANAPVPIRWLRSWNEIPTNRPIFVIANEFFDALPVRQFVMTERGWCERMVQSENNDLKFSLSPLPVALPHDRDQNLAPLGAVLELSPAALSLAEDIGRNVATNGGAALIIDYGHEAQGYGDTLQAVRQHAPVDVLATPGEADLSVHVDFSALAQAARRANACVYGPIEQGSFLCDLGIAVRGEQLARQNPEHAADIHAAIARLTDTEAMGKLFKVMSFVPRDVPTPAGFHRC